jgi:hypothetical protein
MNLPLILKGGRNFVFLTKGKIFKPIQAHAINVTLQQLVL